VTVVTLTFIISPGGFLIMNWLVVVLNMHYNNILSTAVLQNPVMNV